MWQKPTTLKTIEQIWNMREAGKLVAQALNLCREMAQPGVKTADIDAAVEAFYARHGATPLFKGYRGVSHVPFPAVTCLSVNEQVVHGIPGNRKLYDGDILKVDTACQLNGWCADSAISIPIGKVRAERLRLIRVAEETLKIAIEELPKRSRWSEISARMEKLVLQEGFNLVTTYVGHGIGTKMHECPQVPNYRIKNPKEDFEIQPGLVLAVEPMLNMGKSEVLTLPDHWTVVTKDGMPSVHVEHTLALTDKGVMIITANDDKSVFPQLGHSNN